MKQIMVTIQGKQLIPDITLIERLLTDNPTWGRSLLSVKLCELWDWRAPNGQIKDIACRNLLLRLERSELIALPPRQRKSSNGYRNHSPIWISHCTDVITGVLKDFSPLRISCVIHGSEQDRLFRCLLSNYHYLGFKNTVGENLKYLVFSHDGSPLACLLFGSAAWKCASRDTWIGWELPVRERNLQAITNNTRFLILPWIQVSHLASHILSCIAQRIQSDWMAKYAHPLYCLETFVDRSRYHGVCYQAANWHLLGQSTGRGRNDRHHSLSVSKKDIYLYPLVRDIKQQLCDDS